MYIFVVVIKCYRGLFELSSFDIGNENGRVFLCKSAQTIPVICPRKPSIFPRDPIDSIKNRGEEGGGRGEDLS